MATTAPAPRSSSVPGDKLRRNRLLLRQLASCGGVWTDGTKIYEGRELATKRRDTLHRVINAKVPADDRPDWGKRPHEITNLRALERLSRGRQGRPASLADWLAEVALRSRRDPVGETRGICVLRLLRRLSPDHALGLERRMAPPTRQLDERLRILNREGAVLARDVTSLHVTVPKGTPVDDLGPTRGTVLADLGVCRLAVDVPLADMRVMTDRDRQRIAARQFGHGQLAPPEEDSPSL